jgi:hypothetical protein
MGDLQQGLVPILLLVIYGIVDKLLLPLVSKGKESNEGCTKIQEVVNRDAERRIANLEKESGKLRSVVSEISVTVAVSAEILKRIDVSLD